LTCRYLSKTFPWNPGRQETEFNASTKSFLARSFKTFTSKAFSLPGVVSSPMELVAAGMRIEC
jgi:hypothetical protein